MSGQQRVDYLDDMYNRAFIASEPERVEAAKMNNMYTGFGKGQMSAEAKNTLQSRGNLAPQINLSKVKLKGLAGTIIKNFYDVSFVPMTSEAVDVTRYVDDIYLSNSNTFDYDMAHLGCTLDGLIHQGCEQMMLSTRYNPFGDIIFQRILPGHLIIDPNWKTDDSWDIENVWKTAYLTAKQVRNIYGSRSPRILELIKDSKTSNVDYDLGNEDESTPYKNQNNSYGNLYKIIEYHYLDVERRVIRFMRVNGENIDIPDGSPDQVDQFLEERNLSDKKSRIIERVIMDKVYKVAAWCKELDPFNTLEDGNADIQIGRLPFYPFSSDRYGGKNAGIMSLLSDVQVLMNSREARIDDIIAASTSGANLFDPQLFNNNEAMIAAAMKEFRKPDSLIRTAPGMLMQGTDLIKPISRTPFQGELYQEINRLTGYFDQLSGQTATLSGMNESSHDTGALFAKRALQSEIALTTLAKQVESHVRDKAESWYLYAQKINSGTWREVPKYNKNTKKPEGSIELNKKIVDDQGIVVIKNDFSKLPRMKVLAVLSKDGLTQREVDRDRNMQMLQYFRDPMKIAIIEQNALETVDNSGFEKDELREMHKLTMAVLMTQKNIELAMGRAQLQQIEAQTKSINQQTVAGVQEQPGKEQQEQPTQEQQVQPTQEQQEQPQEQQVQEQQEQLPVA